jgi:lysophospholipase II
VQAYDRLGHTLAPHELEYCERWASENILSEHREEEGLKLKKGGLPGSKFFGGVFSCFSK